MISIIGKYTDCEIFANEIDENVMQQLTEVINHPAFTQPIKVMPDVHAGKGAVIGFTMPIDKSDLKIVPNVIGVDIGCGVSGIKLGKVDDIKSKLPEIDQKIKEQIPIGKGVRAEAHSLATDHLYKEVCSRIGIDLDYIRNSVGTLGGGNHFIEIGKDDQDNVWIICHTGSRYLGKSIAEYWQKVAVKELTEKQSKQQINYIKANYPKEEWDKQIKALKGNKVSKDLAYLEDDLAAGYLNDMKIAQSYAFLNRIVILQDIYDIINPICNIVMQDPTMFIIDTAHNYIDLEGNKGIIRKGAIRSYKEEYMLIPFNRQYGTIVANGKTNPKWNYSAPHGAGRLMSRSKAKQSLSMSTYTQQMQGIYSTTVSEGNLDEAPNAYKDPSLILEQIADTAEIVTYIKPIYNLKE